MRASQTQRERTRSGAGTQCRQDFTRIDGSSALFGVIGDDLVLAVAARLDGGHGFGNACNPQHFSFDRGQIDSLTSDLFLKILATEVSQAAALVHLAQITGSINARRGVVG